MTARLQKAIDIFLDSINNNTLAKGTCVACAVGNLVAHGLGGQIVSDTCEISHKHYYDYEPGDNMRLIRNDDWGDAFMTVEGESTLNLEKLNDPFVTTCIKSTDFTLRELMAIESAFENNTSISFMEYHMYSRSAIRADQIRGLEAVVKIIMFFDEVNADVKEVFTNKLTPELVTV